MSARDQIRHPVGRIDVGAQITEVGISYLLDRVDKSIIGETYLGRHSILIDQVFSLIAGENMPGVQPTPQNVSVLIIRRVVCHLL